MTLRSVCALLSIFAGGVIAASGPAPPAAEVPLADRIAPPPPGERRSAASRDLGAELQMIDPTRDGFDTEVLNGAGGKVLKKLIEVMQSRRTAEGIAPYVDPAFACPPLRPDTLEPIFDHGGLVLSVGGPVGGEHDGLDGLVEALRGLAAPFDPAEVHVKFKIVRVDPAGADTATTRVIYLAMGPGPEGHVQQNANWDVRWNIQAGYDHPRLERIEVSDFNEHHVPRLLYSECTAAVFAEDGSYERIREGIDRWWGRIDAGMGYSFYGDYTTALGDVDGDGLDDLYICQPGSVPNMLFRHAPDGKLEDISDNSGVQFLNDTPTALFIDINNDGHQDLLVATLLHVIVLRGEGTGRFSTAGEIAVDNAVSFSAADYDNDGRLDVYVCRYSASSRATVSGSSIYDSDDGRPNVLLHNEGGFRFRDVTVESGIDEHNRKFSFAAVWEDYDNDGDLDVYVANDFGRNNLYRNDDGRFTDAAAVAGAEDMAAGMGASWGDFNLDGHMDLYVSNMFSSAGGRINDKPQIESIAGSAALTGLERFAKGNTLLENLGDGTFRDVSFRAGVTMGRWSWGGEFVDFNNDGWEDLVVPNGFVTNTNSKDL